MVLSAIYSNGMIIQKDKTNIIEGTSNPGCAVDVTFNNKKYSVSADGEGRFAVTLDCVPAGGPYAIIVEDGSQKREIKDVYAGDVFLLAGQSNMELPVSRTLETYGSELTDVNYPLMRMFQLPKEAVFGEPDKILASGEWIAADNDAFTDFSALGFYFAQMKQESDGIPVGLIHAAVGGTHIEAFLSREQALASANDLKIKAKEQGRELVCRCGVNDTCKMCCESRIKADEVPGYVADKTRLDMENMEDWYKEINSGDRGLKEGWQDGIWDETEDIASIDVPCSWLDNQYFETIGTVWVQKVIDIPEDMCNQPGRLRIGTIVDADETYINGVLVGKTDYFYPPRNYTFPEGILKPGKNVITVRVIINNNVGEFKKDMPYYIKAGNREISLEGKWSSRIGIVASRKMGDQSFFTWYPTSLYNSMIYPVRNISFKTLFFYQGESNARYPEDYEYLMKDMIAQFRSIWGEDMPFIFAELPRFDGESWEEENDEWDRMRVSLRKVAQDVEGTRMVPMYDLGQYNEIHPQNKRDVARRFYDAYLDLVEQK